MFDAEAVTHADSTGLEALVCLTTELRREEIALVVARFRRRLRDQFGVAGVTATIGRERSYPTVGAAVDAFSADLSCREDDASSGSVSEDR